MAYADQSDLAVRLTQKVLTELSDFDNDGVADASVITAALDFASGRIDSYVQGRYAIPLAASQQVKDLCVEIAAWRLFSLRNRPLPGAMLQSYQEAMKLLTDVSKGAASLDGTSDTAQTSEMDVVTRDHDDDPEAFDDNKLTSF